jgi:sec-independent protein translocase protein TatB
MGIPPTIEFASLGMADSLILMVMALVVFGPRKLPQIGRQIGKLMYEFRKASNDFKFQMEEELRNAEDADRRKQDEERRRALELAAPPPAQTVEAQAGIGAVETDPAPPNPVEGDHPATPPEIEPETNLPRIQPPSIGEQVPATRPGQAAQAATPANEQADAASSTDSTAAAATVPGQQDLNASEQAAHHG